MFGNSASDCGTCDTPRSRIWAGWSPHTESPSSSRSTPWSTSPLRSPRICRSGEASTQLHLHRFLETKVLAEVGVEHLRVALDLVRCAARDRLAAGQHQHGTAESQDERHVVLDDQERLALG